MDHGGLITENCFGTKPDAHNFPSRNRIIAGMLRCTDRSGSCRGPVVL
ncbi:MAG: DNA-processing protein DprA [Bacteroidota bacterium]